MPPLAESRISLFTHSDMDSNNGSTDGNVLASTTPYDDSTADHHAQLTQTQPMAPMSPWTATSNRTPLTPALQSLLQAIHSGRGTIPASHVIREKSPLLPYSDVPRIYLPLMDEPGFFKAVEDAPAMYRCISLRSPVPNELLVGYESEDDDLTTASRRHYVTQYYIEMMTARLGRMEEEGASRRSGRIARKRAAPTNSSQSDQDGRRHWFDRPRCPDDSSSS